MMLGNMAVGLDARFDCGWKAEHRKDGWPNSVGTPRETLPYTRTDGHLHALTESGI